MGIINKEKDRAKFKRDLAVLISLAKGKPSLKEGLWFYNMFVPTYTTTASLAREKLLNAWYLEEEDIRQFLLAYIWEQKVSTNFTNLRLRLVYPLEAWLGSQVFRKRPENWETNWKEYITDIQHFSDPEIKQVLETKNNLYEAYFQYLKYGLELDYRAMVPILLRDRWTISDDDRLIQNKYRKQQEKDNGRRIY